VQENGKYGFIDEQGQMVIPARFDDAQNFAANGLALVQENGKYGYINPKGEMVIPARFDGAMSFADYGLAPTRENGKIAYIDKTGQKVWDVENVCETIVLKRADEDQIYWPKKSREQICAEAR
jgi:hypothetical protein